MAECKQPTLRALQTNLPWALGYSTAFEAAKPAISGEFHDDSSMAHLDFTHALLHIGKATGQLMAMCENADHDRQDGIEVNPAARVDNDERDTRCTDFPSHNVEKYLADLVICAMRLANVRPGGAVDLQAAVIQRLEQKNGVKLGFVE
jgi:hypothetical protein